MIPAIITMIASLIGMLILYLINSREISEVTAALTERDADIDRIDDDVDKVVEATNANNKTLEDTVADLYEQIEQQSKYITILTHGYATLDQKLEENEKSDTRIKDTIYDLAWTLDQHGDKLEELEKLEAYYDGQISRIDCRLGEMYYAKRRFHEALEDIDECLDFFHDEINTLMKTDEYIASAVKQCAEGGAALAKQVEDLDEMKDFISEKIDENIEDLKRLKVEVNTHNNSLIEAWEALGELYMRMSTAEENINAEVNAREEEDKQLGESIKDLQLTCHLLDIDTDNIYDELYGTHGKKGITDRLKQIEDLDDCIIEELNRPKEGDVIKALKNIFDKFETN